jgi:hypothetical protein
MDGGISSALASLRSDLRRVETTLSARLHQVEGQIGASEAAICAQLRSIFVDPRGQLGTAAADVRGMLDELADRLGALEARLDRLQADRAPRQRADSAYAPDAGR